MMNLELLSPAKNYEQGLAAINHGADAVYIGAPAFGARAAATNTIADIEHLARYAHTYRCKVFATVNTLLFDNEIEAAVDLCHKLYHAGCDALIIQDLGLLECDLPPIELHASTQTHNIDPKRIKFLEQVGFSRVILARETSLEQMQTIRSQTSVALEAFVQGALCVSYSGQCYLSQYLSNRSGNRGCCGQPCRSAYNLYNQQGKRLIHNGHLLSLKDFSAAQHIESMVDIGITSFKIEGRLKDLGYVKNVTAYYRQILDQLMSGKKDCKPSSSGHCSFFFVPDLEKTFNRGFTDYFLTGRQPMASHATQKSIGKYIGKIIGKTRNSLTINTDEQLHSGDGLCFFSDNGLDGFLVNHIDGNRITPNKMQEINIGTDIWRNNDYAFEKLLSNTSSSRKIVISIILSYTCNKLHLTITDSDNCSAEATIDYLPTPAINPSTALLQIEKQLSKLGDTPFETQHIESQLPEPLFIPTSTLNELRRNAVDRLIATRIDTFKNNSISHTPNNIPYYENPLDYRANVLNEKAKQFYERHQTTVSEWGLERSSDYSEKALMTTKYCLRYELHQCLRHKNNQHVDPDYQDGLYLDNNGKKLRLQFDCKKCQMTIVSNE